MSSRFLEARPADVRAGVARVLQPRRIARSRGMRRSGQSAVLPSGRQRIREPDRRARRARLRARLVYRWLPLRRGVVRKTLGARLCDVLMGVPADPARRRHDDSLLSIELCARHAHGLGRAGFIVRRPAHPHEQDRRSVDRRRRRRSPARVGARPAGHLGQRKGFPVYGAVPVAQRMVDALATGELDIAVGWGPAVGYFARQAKVPLDARAGAGRDLGARIVFDRHRRAR